MEGLRGAKYRSTEGRVARGQAHKLALLGREAQEEAVSMILGIQRREGIK